MAKKKKVEKIGVITAEELLKATRGIQDIPFRTGAHEKRKPRKKVDRNNMHEFM